jgi:hypothetical protein
MRNAGRLAVLGVVGAVALLAGCGTVSAGRPTAPATSVAAALETPQQRAVADAANLVASFAGFHWTDFPASGPTTPTPDPAVSR